MLHFASCKMHHSHIVQYGVLHGVLLSSDLPERRNQSIKVNTHVFARDRIPKSIYSWRTPTATTPMSRPAAPTTNHPLSTSRVSAEHITQAVNSLYACKRYFFFIEVYIHFFLKGFLRSWTGAGILKVPAN